MVALTHLEDVYELESTLQVEERESRRTQRDVTSRTRHAERARYDRRRRTAHVDGAHRRRDKRNYL